MKAKKLLVSVLTAGMVITATTGNVMAADQTGITSVTYDNRNNVPDPENPDTPQWAVTIPSAVTFTDDNKIIDASVELMAKNGGSLPITDVTVTVASANNYKLKNGGDELGYKLIYADTTMTDVNTEAAKLKESNTKQEGKAVLGGDMASVRGSYTDTLTYTISHTTP